MNQLTRENNQVINQTWTYEYDGAGNLLNKKRYTYTTGTLGTLLQTITYAYETAYQKWGDQLTSYNGQAIRYDNAGNPTYYMGADLMWQGKRLTYHFDGWAIESFYYYDENGIRTRKVVGATTTNYNYNGSLLMSLTQGANTLLFSYDASGQVVSVNFNGTDYYYLRNGQGDIVKIINASGTSVVEYKYDTWGKPLAPTGTLASTLGAIQPFRYRGYIFDNETGWYYLKSRYYDPSLKRFISRDVYMSTGQGILGLNMYAYCNNSPVFCL